MPSHKCPKTVLVSRHGELLQGCSECISSVLQQGDSAGYDRSWQQKQYRRDTVQKNQPREFIKAYGIDKAREAGFSDEQLRKYS